MTFRLPAEAGAEAAWVAGDWNDWSLDANPMKATKNGQLECTLDLDPGRSYRFRYYLGDGRWENDWAADSYIDNEFGGADSVVIIDADAAVKPTPTKPASRAKKAPPTIA